MLQCSILVSVVALFIVHAANAQSVVRAYPDDNDGKVHVAFANGMNKTIEPQPDQVACADVTVADDGHTVGWTVLVKNCCTSYPIPRSIVVLKDGHQYVIGTGQMIWRWRFLERGRRIAVLSGPVHGKVSEALLYDWRGKELSSWDGSDTPPSWAKIWQWEFQR